jgi:hypothetical protein
MPSFHGKKPKAKRLRTIGAGMDIPKVGFRVPFSGQLLSADAASSN